jgi:hypothetical protein
MTLKDKKIKIRHCFFSAYQAKMVNWVSASASAQHIEAPINTNNNLLYNQSRFCCQDFFFAPGLQYGANLSIAQRFACGLI